MTGPDIHRYFKEMKDRSTTRSRVSRELVWMAYANIREAHQSTMANIARQQRALWLADNPDATPAEIERLLQRRLERGNKLIAAVTSKAPSITTTAVYLNRNQRKRIIRSGRKARRS